MLRRHVCATGVARVNQRAAIMARGEAIPPPFARAALPASQSQMPEEIELIWEDGVAPEMTIDFDATFVSKMEGLQWWLGGFAFFAGLMGVVSLTDPQGKKRTVRIPRRRGLLVGSRTPSRN